MIKRPCLLLIESTSNHKSPFKSGDRPDMAKWSCNSLYGLFHTIAFEERSTVARPFAASSSCNSTKNGSRKPQLIRSRGRHLPLHIWIRRRGTSRWARLLKSKMKWFFALGRPAHPKFPVTALHSPMQCMHTYLTRLPWRARSQLSACACIGNHNAVMCRVFTFKAHAQVIDCKCKFNSMMQCTWCAHVYCHCVWILHVVAQPCFVMYSIFDLYLYQLVMLVYQWLSDY